VVATAAVAAAGTVVVVMVLLLLLPTARVPGGTEEALEALLALRCLPRWHLCRRSCSRSPPSVARGSFRGVMVVGGMLHLGPLHAVPGWPLCALRAVVTAGNRHLGPLHAVPGWPLCPLRAVVTAGARHLGPLRAVPGWPLYPLRAVTASRHLGRRSVGSVGMFPAGPPSARRHLVLLLAMHACASLACAAAAPLLVCSDLIGVIICMKIGANS